MSNIGNKETMAKNLRYYLEKTGETQRILAEVAGVATSTVNDWVQAKKYPRIDKIEIIAEHWGILKSDLIEDKEEIQKKNNLSVEVVLRMESDPEFFSLVETLCTLDGDKIRSISAMLRNFL